MEITTAVSNVVWITEQRNEKLCNMAALKRPLYIDIVLCSGPLGL